MGILYRMFSFIDRDTLLCFIYLGVFPSIYLSKVFISAAIEYFPVCKACFTYSKMLLYYLMVHDNAYHKMSCDVI